MYLENYEKYLGTGEKDASGKDLKTFLESYDPRRFETPANTVDNLIFTYKEENGKRSLSKLLLIKRGNHPSIGWWALPGGFVEMKENLDISAARELEEETGVKGLKAVQLATYGDFDRDPRTRVITTAYVSLIKEGSVCANAGDDASDAAWFSVKAEKAATKAVSDGVTEEIYDLTFSAGDINLYAAVAVITDKTDILTKTDYKMVSNDGIAGDHAAIILHGMDYVLKVLNS